MSFRISVLPPSPALADDVMGYVVRRRAVGAPPQLDPFSAHFPANMYSALTIVHRGRLVDPVSGSVTAAVSFSGAMTREAVRNYHELPETTVVLFKPGRLTDLLRVPAGELTDRWLAGADVLTLAEQIEIDDRMAAQPTLAREIHVLEQVLERRLRRSRETRASTLSRTVQRLVWRLPHMTVSELAQQVGVGERQLHRHFHNTFGVPPKALIRLARLQLTLWHIQAAARQMQPTLATVAHDAGFADQAHMAKDFKALVGRSPTTLRQRMLESRPSDWAYELPQDMLHPLDAGRPQQGQAAPAF